MELILSLLIIVSFWKLVSIVINKEPKTIGKRYYSVKSVKKMKTTPPENTREIL